MKFTLIVMLLAVATQGPKDTAAVRGERLRKQQPKVTWNMASAGTADLDCDGRPDTFLWGKTQITRTFRLESGPVTQKWTVVVFGLERARAARTQTVQIPYIKDTGYYGFRRDPQNIEIRPLSCEWEGGKLPGCDAKKKCESLWVTDGEGAEFLVFWDAERGELSALRPGPK